MSFKSFFFPSFSDLVEKGNVLFLEDRFGEAKLTWEKSLSKCRDKKSNKYKSVQEKIDKCCQRLARNFIEESLELSLEDNPEEVASLLDQAVSICSSPAILEEVEKAKNKIEKKITKMFLSNSQEISEEEILAIIAGTWSEKRADEYALLPDSFHNALILSHDQKHDEAAQILNEIARSTPTARYVWMELGRVRYEAGDFAGADIAFTKFKMRTDEKDVDVDDLILAYDYWSRALEKMDKKDEAKEKLQSIIHLNPESYVVFFRYGIFLRQDKDYDGSIKSLEKAVKLMGQMNPDFNVIKELGFAYLAKGDTPSAESNFAAVVEHLASKGQHDQFDPETTVSLAKIYEEKNEFDRAADLYRHLAMGYDIHNHYHYNAQATRLLKLAGAPAEIIDKYARRTEERSKNMNPEKLTKNL